MNRNLKIISFQFFSKNNSYKLFLKQNSFAFKIKFKAAPGGGGAKIAFDLHEIKIRVMKIPGFILTIGKPFARISNHQN